MIGKLVRRMLIAQTLSALTVSLCLLIDNMIIGRFLGLHALASYSYANPLLLTIGAAGTLMSTGIQVSCSRSLGKGSREETNRCYSTALVTSAVFSILFAVAAVVFRTPLARLLGAGDTSVLGPTSDYIAGFSIGAPAMMSALVLIPFMQIAGQSNLLIVAVLSMTVADVGLDLLNAYVLDFGMFGMGLASSLSYYIALIIAGIYFMSKKCVFRFSLSEVKREKLRECLAGGAPALAGMIASVLFVFLMNRILNGTGGNGMVATYAIVSAIGGTSNCISTGMSGVALTLSSVLYTEEDKTGMRNLLKTLLRAAVVMGAGVMILLLIFAPSLVRHFTTKEGAAPALVAAALRYYALGLIPCCLINAFKGCYQGTGRVRHMEIISVLEGVILPIAGALLIRSLAGRSGVWFHFLSGEMLTLCCIIGWVWYKKHRVTWRTEDLLLFRRDFGVPPEDLLETDIRGMDDVMTASRTAEAFCRDHGGSDRLSAHLALCVEEMGTNIVTHGFAPDGGNSLSIRLQYKKGRWIMRFRDDCTAFDPISHVSQHTGSDSVGIRLAMRMADEARYTYSMNLNNLIMILRGSESPEP